MSRLFSRRRLIAAGGTAAVGVPLFLPNRVSAAATSGQLKTLISPVRVFDSREPGSVLGGAKLDVGDIIAVTVAGAYEDGDLASAVFANVTITETEGAGYLAVRGEDLSGMRPPPSTSNVNWSTSGQTLANLALTTVGGEHAIEVHCLGAGRTHVIVDIQGYVPFTA